MSATPGEQLSVGRYRRRVLGWGAVALVVVLVVGSAITLARVEDDLGSRVSSAFDDAGIAGVSVEFSGQDGTLVCDRPLDDPQAAVDLAERERGVRDVDLDGSCTGDGPADEEIGEPPPTATTSTTSTTMLATVADTVASTTSTTIPDPTTVLDILVDDPQFSVFRNALESADLGAELAGSGPLTVFAPTDDAFATLEPNFNAALAADPDALLTLLRHHIVDGELPADEPFGSAAEGAIEVIEAANGMVVVIDRVLLPDGLDVGVVADVPSVVADYDGGRLTFSGRLGTEAQRATLLAAAGRQLAADNVVDQFEVDPDVTVAEGDVEALVAFVGLVPASFVRGEITAGRDQLTIEGVYVDADGLAAIEAVAADLGATLDVEERPTARAADADALAGLLNAEVATEPIRFEPNSAAIVPEADAVLDRLAAHARSLAGVVVTVEGHTDSDGTDVGNFLLSFARADAVIVALAERGVPPSTLVAVGLGATEPILVDGVEDSAASRRVEFAVARE